MRRIVFLIQEFFDEESNYNCTVIIIFFVTEYATPVIYQCILITSIGCDSAAAAATSNGAFFQKEFDNPNHYVPLVTFQRYRIEV
jgi:hypothetical protein